MVGGSVAVDRCPGVVGVGVVFGVVGGVVVGGVVVGGVV